MFSVCPHYAICGLRILPKRVNFNWNARTLLSFVSERVFLFSNRVTLTADHLSNLVLRMIFSLPLRSIFRCCLDKIPYVHLFSFNQNGSQQLSHKIFYFAFYHINVPATYYILFTVQLGQHMTVTSLTIGIHDHNLFPQFSLTIDCTWQVRKTTQHSQPYPLTFCHFLCQFHKTL